MLASEPPFESFCKWNVFCCKKHNHFHSFFYGPIGVRIVQLVVKAQLLLCLPHLSISLSFCFSFEKRPTICSKMLLTWQEFDLIWFFIFLFFIWRRKRIWFSTRLDTTTSVCVLAFFFFFEKSVSRDYALFNESRALFTGSTNLFFSKTFITNGSHSTIHTFKKYFATMF